MRIGVDYTAAINQSAGIGRFVRSLFTAVTAMDPETQYVLVHSAPNAGRQIVLPASPNVTERELRFRERTMIALWHRLQLPLPIDFMTGAVDIFHAPDFILPPLRRGISILTVHDLSFLIHPECADARLRAFLEHVVPRSAARADFIVTDSENTRNDVIVLLDADPDRVFVVPGGVDASFAPAAPEAVAAMRATYDLRDPYILAVGVIEPRKNFPRLIDAYVRFRKRTGLQHKLVIAGGKGWLSEETYRRAAQSGFQDDIRFTGYVPDADLTAMYSGAAVFIYPSLYEGFGLPVLEAMACGAPVICSDTSSLPEFAGDAAQLVSPSDTESISTGLESVCGDEQRQDELRRRGLRRAAEFSWERSAARLIEIYRKVAAAA